MKQRLKQFIDYVGVNNYTFEKNIGTSEGTLRRFFGDKNGLTVATLAKIADFYPQLSLDWLITGRGSMLIDRSPSNSIIGDNNTLAGHDIHIPIPSPTSPDPLAQLHEKDRTIATLANANAQLVQQLLDLTSQKTQKQ